MAFYCPWNTSNDLVSWWNDCLGGREDGESVQRVLFISQHKGCVFCLGWRREDKRANTHTFVHSYIFLKKLLQRARDTADFLERGEI